jgi:hypothetical protein
VNTLNELAGQSQQPGPEYMKLCVYAETVPTGFRLSTLVHDLDDKGHELSWKKADGNWQLHSDWRDQLTNESHSMAIEFVQPNGELSSAECGGYPGDLLIARFEFDHQNVARFAIGRSIQAAFGDIFGKDGVGRAPSQSIVPSEAMPKPSQPSSEPVNQSAISVDQLKLLYLSLNEECRGGQHDSEDATCKQRDNIGAELEKRGICWAYSDYTVYPMDYDWHPCSQARPS